MKRWQQAQQAEQEHQSHQELMPESVAEERLNKFGIGFDDIEDASILGVGAGTGMIHSIPADEAVGLDPMMNSIPDIDRSHAHIITGAGESLPFLDDRFDIVISYNVLDHTADPERVLQEIRRVLVPEGDLLFNINVFEQPSIVRSLLDRIDPPHPHHFSRAEIRTLLRNTGFDIEVRRDGYPPAIKKNPSWKLKLAVKLLGMRTVDLRCTLEG